MRGRHIGKWLNLRRGEAKNGKLSLEKTHLIERALGEDALVPIVDFERTLAEVARYKSTYRSLPIQSTVDLDMFRLGKWLSQRRIEYNTGLLSAANARQLDRELGLEWRPKFNSNMVRLASHLVILFSTSLYTCCGYFDRSNKFRAGQQ